MHPCEEACAIATQSGDRLKHAVARRHVEARACRPRSRGERRAPRLAGQLAVRADQPAAAVIDADPWTLRPVIGRRWQPVDDLRRIEGTADQAADEDTHAVL